MVRRGLRGAMTLAAIVVLGCSGGDDSAAADGGTLIAFNAGSLGRPLRAALDTFAATESVTIEQESAGSLETARKLTELGKTPDIIALADHEVFPQLLMPAHTTWYVQFARNRMVIAYTDRSRFSAEVTPDNWWSVVRRPGVEVGRSEPSLDPNGYRTLLTLQLAERHYRQPGLYRSLLDAAPQRNVRPKEADLVALLQAGELDYIWSYESIAQGANLRYLTLPTEIDLSSPAHASLYETVSVRVMGNTQADSVTFRGEPIVYGISIPTNAPNPAVATRFLVWLLSEDGQRVLRGASLDALESPVLVGNDAPDAVRRALQR